MGKVLWQNYWEIPCESIYNMDKASTDTTKHRFKVIADAAAILKCWRETTK
jgi:hypothetical protein